MTIKSESHLDHPILKQIAINLRETVLDLTTRYSGHPTSCFSAVEIMTMMFFGGILRYRPLEPAWPQRDRFVLSKGHAAPLLYAVLHQAGYFSKDLLDTFRELNSPLQGHPVQNLDIGVEVSSGSLGQGLSFGLGHALSGRLNKLDYNVWVLLGDGECEEGQIWEAAMAATHYKARHLKAIVDYNKMQQTGPIAREMALEPFPEKWRSFGWFVAEADGHDFSDLGQKLQLLKNIKDQPSVLIAHTVKGKGVSFLEDRHDTHGKPLTEEEKARAVEEIRCV